MSLYTVIAVYREPLGQRYATTVEADGPESAEIEAQRVSAADNGMDPDDRPLLVAGVVPGAPELADMYTDGYTFGIPGEDS